MIQDDLTDVTMERFWSLVEKGSSDECWAWRGPRDAAGYGRFRVANRPEVAHRVAYTHAIGPIPRGLFGCHRCDNPSCVNPAHIFIGTSQDNFNDMRRKGRAASAANGKHGSVTCPESIPRGDSHYLRMHPEKVARGSANPNAVLDEAQVLSIRELAVSGVSRRRLSALFGAAKVTIDRIVNGKSWRHV